jgi:hypothetical protein
MTFSTPCRRTTTRGAPSERDEEKKGGVPNDDVIAALMVGGTGEARIARGRYFLGIGQLKKRICPLALEISPSGQ